MRKGWVALLALLLAWPAWAGFDVELDAAAAYNYSGSCAATGSHAGRTVPRCSGTADGSFYLRYFTRVLTGAATVTPQMLRFVTVTEPDGTAAACFNVACTATTPGSNPHGAISFNAGSDITVDLDAVSTCNDIDEQCQSGAGSNVAVRDLQAAGNCASTTCNNSELICRVTYLGTAGTGCTGSDDDDLDVSSLKLTVTE